MSEGTGVGHEGIALGLAHQGLTQGLLLVRLLGSGLGTATVQPALPILLVGWLWAPPRTRKSP